MEEKNKTYTASDFARYHAGTMSADEMHALERAALDDPFLADALEGYAYSESPKNDIIELRERLTEKRKQKKVFSILSVAQNKWWRIAALFIIILGVGYLFYPTSNTRIADNTLAKNDIKKPELKPEEPSAILKDSTTANNDIAFENKEAPPSPGRNKAFLPKSNNEIERQKISAEPELKSRDAFASSSPKENNYSTDSYDVAEMNVKKDTSKEYVMRGIVKDDNGVPIPLATIKDKGKLNATVTDSSGQFTLLSADSTTKATANAVGYISKDILLKKDALPIITMNRNQGNLDEVVVTGYGTRRKKTLSQSKKLQGKVPGLGIQKSEAQPFPENEKFTEYIHQNLIPVYDSNNIRVSGEVELSFSLTKYGRPQHISILRSDCKICEAQAIHLLENGPNWKGQKNAKGTVVIKF